MTNMQNYPVYGIEKWTWITNNTINTPLTAGENRKQKKIPIHLKYIDHDYDIQADQLID